MTKQVRRLRQGISGKKKAQPRHHPNFKKAMTDTSPCEAGAMATRAGKARLCVFHRQARPDFSVHEGAVATRDAWKARPIDISRSRYDQDMTLGKGDLCTVYRRHDYAPDQEGATSSACVGKARPSYRSSHKAGKIDHISYRADATVAATQAGKAGATYCSFLIWQARPIRP